MRKNESEAEYLGFVGTHTLKKSVACPQHVWLILPCIFLASPPGSSWRLYSFPTLKTFLQPYRWLFKCDLTQASLLCDSPAASCGHNCWNGTWLWNPTTEIPFSPSRVTIILSLFEILLTTGMKLQGSACKPQKSSCLYFFIKEFHFMAALSVQMPSHNSAKEKWNSLCKYLFLIY